MSGRSTVLLPVVAKSLVQSDSMAKTIPPSVQLSRRRRRRVAAAAEQRETPFRPIRSARRPHRSPERSRPRRRRRLAVASSCAVPGRRSGRRSPGRQRLEHAVRQLVLTPLLLLLVPAESTTGMVIERRAAPSASFRRGRRQRREPVCRCRRRRRTRGERRSGPGPTVPPLGLVSRRGSARQRRRSLRRGLQRRVDAAADEVGLRGHHHRRGPRLLLRRSTVRGDFNPARLPPGYHDVTTI